MPVLRRPKPPASSAATAHPSELLSLPAPFYSTGLGSLYCGDSARLLTALPNESIDLVVTSPPYALHFQKEYGNVTKAEYVEWFRTFGEQIFRVLKPTGSFVLNIGGSYNAGEPTRSLYHFRRKTGPATRWRSSQVQMRQLLERAQSPQQFQSVGLHCRELLITLGQTVFDAERHQLVEGQKPSSTDAKRMLEACIASELGGSGNEELRKHAKAAFDLANALQHRRTATFRDAALCAEATTSIVNLIAIVSGRRDPEGAST